MCFLRLLWWFTLLTFLSGCNSTWFYRPNQKQYTSYQSLSPNKPRVIRSLSGNHLNTLLVPAETPGKRTLLIHFHGNAGNITWTAQRYLWLKRYGYDLLVFDYSGYGESSGKPSPKTTWQDAVTILDYALQLKQQNERWHKVMLAGTSLGGNILLNALVSYPKASAFDRVFIDSSFLSYKEVASSMVRRGPGGELVGKLAELLISDEFAPASHEQLALDQPLIVAHCQEDQLIDARLGKALFDRVDSNQKQWLLLDGCQHAQGFTESHSENQQRLLRALMN